MIRRRAELSKAVPRLQLLALALGCLGAAGLILALDGCPTAADSAGTPVIEVAGKGVVLSEEPEESLAQVRAHYSRRVKPQRSALLPGVGYPVPLQGCWQCSKPGPASCGRTVSAGTTAQTRYGAPARCPNNGPLPLPVGPCCERAWQARQLLELAFCSASASGYNPLGLQIAGRSGVPTDLEVLDLDYSVPDGAPVYRLTDNTLASAVVQALSVTLAVDRPPRSSQPAVVSWGDGSASTVTEGGVHVYASPGVYTVRVDGRDACGILRRAQLRVTLTATAAARCGDGRVDPGEDCHSCPADAGECPPIHPPDPPGLWHCSASWTSVLSTGRFEAVPGSYSQTCAPAPVGGEE